MKKMKSAGGFPAIWYTLRQARRSGGMWRMYKALRSRNACKTCALGMGGQSGGMVNEEGRFPEVCKKSVQAMAADMQGKLRDGLFDEFDFDKLGRLSPRELESLGRITTPLIASEGDRSYRPASWSEALDVVVDAMRKTDPDRSFFYFSGRSSNEAGFLLQLFARMYGTNNVNNCSYFCHQASGVGLKSVTGSGTATVQLEDVAHCDCIFLIGGNPASNHPRFMRSLMDLKRRGGTVVVVNPLKELGLVNFKVPSDVRSLLFGSKIADHYVQPNIGGDIALMTGIARSLLDLDAIDEGFIENATDGWDACREQILSQSWETLESRSGIDRATMKHLAQVYAASKSTIFVWTMGITHHKHGVENVQMIGNLALMRGMLGREHAGLLPLRGHSNVQGIGSIGAVPNLSERVLHAMESRFGVKLPTSKGLDTLACIRRAAAGDVDFAWHLGGNLWGSAPDAVAAGRSLQKVGTSVFLSTTMNQGHVFGRGQTTVILPVLARDEESQATTQESMFNFVRMSDGGPSRFDGPRSEVEVIAQIASRVVDECPLDFATMRDHTSIRAAIAQVIPGYEKLASIDTTKNEFQIGGRTFHTPKFRTDSGRAKFHAVAIPDDQKDDDALRLMTVRSEGQFNTVVYEEEDIYRGQERRDVIMMNASDGLRLGFKENDRVIVRSETGHLAGILVRFVDISPGNVCMYYPEANVLVPATEDSRSRTPAFKNVAVRLERVVALPQLSSPELNS